MAGTGPRRTSPRPTRQPSATKRALFPKEGRLIPVVAWRPGFFNIHFRCERLIFTERGRTVISMEGGNIHITRLIRWRALFGAVFFACVFLWAVPARAATIIPNPDNRIPDGYVMTAQGSPYLTNGIVLRVGANTIVTMEPGAVLALGYNAQIIVDGTFRISGTEDNPAVITSDKDGDYIEDAHGGGPAPGDWFRIIASQNAARIEINHAILRYGGKSGWGAVTGSYGTVEISDSLIEYSVAHGVLSQGYSSFITVRDSIIRNNTIAGVRAFIGGSASIESTVLSGNRYGIEVSETPAERVWVKNNSIIDNTNAGLHYAFGTGSLDATENWWGHASGPQHLTNPNGQGDAITGNRIVLFDPWVGNDPSNSAPALSFIEDEEYVDSGVLPRVSFIGQDVPMFKVLYSDANGDNAQYVRLVAGDEVFGMATSSGGVFEFVPDDGVFGKGVRPYYFEASDGVDAVRFPASGTFEFEVRNVPVILVPGILGTKLYNGDEEVWAHPIKIVTDVGDDFMNVLAMSFDGTSENNQIITGDVIRDFPFTDVFTGLVNGFDDAGYIEGVDLFVVPYDWRLDIRESSQTLAQKIEEVLAQTSSQQVNIVAHSMGGLLTKQYILDNGSSNMKKIVFVGTPHLGAPKAVKTLLFGDNLLGVPGLSADRVQYIGQNMLSIYELLPSRSYIDESSYYYYDHTQGDVFGYDRMEQFLIDSGLNPVLLPEADIFHSSALDNFDTAGLDAYNINGCTTPTLTSIIKRDNEEYSAFFYEGDGTVPLVSSKAVNIDSNRQYYFKNEGFLSGLFPKVSHPTMPSADGIRELIIQIIAGADITLPNNATQDSSQCIIAGKLVSVHSPVNLHIYDSEDNHVGRGENGDIEYNISGVAYEEIGENKFVFLPESDGVSYQVELDGTGDGTFSLRVSKVEGNEVTETAYYNDLPVSTVTEATLTLATSASATVLSIDQNGTGNFTPASMSAVLNSEQSADTTKPSTSISVSGGASSAGFELSASDDNSGILKTEYSLDSGSTWHTYQNQVIITSIGQTVVYYRSKDRAGNLEDYRTKTITVYSPAVVITPLAAPSTSDRQSAQDRHSELGSESSPEIEPEPEVLGERTERPRNERYTEREILAALTSADIATLLDYLGRMRDLSLEQSVGAKYGARFGLTPAMTNFIAYGTKSTQALGAGERAGVLHSFYEAFGRLPKTTIDWGDVVKISTNEPPSQRSVQAEQKAKDSGADDERTIMLIAYGLRPAKRDIVLERGGIVHFIEAYGRLPSSTPDWNVLRSIVYQN